MTNPIMIVPVHLGKYNFCSVSVYSFGCCGKWDAR